VRLMCADALEPSCCALEPFEMRSSVLPCKLLDLLLLDLKL